MKHPKFVIAENPMTERESHPLYVIHLREPIIIAQVHHFDLCAGDQIEEVTEALESCKRQYSVGSYTEIYNTETAVLGAVHIAAPIHGEPQEVADKLAKIMRRMADWYRAYCIWEDKNIDNG